MSDQTYTPRAGSKAEAAIAALQARKWLSAAELAAEIECERANLDGNIAVAVTHGLIRRVARDGQAGFALGSTGDPPAREYEDEGTAARRIRSAGKKRKAKKQAKPKRAAPVVQEPPAPHSVNGGQSVGILEDGTIVIVDEQGHAMSLPAAIARRVAELVARTA